MRWHGVVLGGASGLGLLTPVAFVVSVSCPCLLPLSLATRLRRLPMRLPFSSLLNLAFPSPLRSEICVAVYVCVYIYIYIYILDPHEAPYGACKSYRAEFEEEVVFLCFGVFVFLCC